MGRLRFLIAICACVLAVSAALVLAACSRGAYVGSTMSHRYHDPSCMWAEELPKDRAVWFSTAEEAEGAGYEPCSTCLPGGPPSQ